MINCLIVDDEPLAREVIRLHISKLAGWNILQECVSAMEAYEALINHNIQVIFLDIQMPRIQGTDFLRSLKNPPKIIFTSAHPGYAVEGFELNAIDYLLKPITFDRFNQAIAKVEQQLKPGLTVTPSSSHQSRPDRQEDFIFIKQDTRLVKVSFADILFLEARRDFTQIHLKDKKLLAGFHLKMLEDMLPSSLFMRVHRSYIVRLSAIEALSGNIIEMKGFQIPVSSANREVLAQALKI
ncbi:MAG: LytTR family DNA-binding domain-containing protein [Chitinophagaceae bacterium]